RLRTWSTISGWCTRRCPASCTRHDRSTSSPVVSDSSKPPASSKTARWMPIVPAPVPGSQGKNGFVTIGSVVQETDARLPALSRSPSQLPVTNSSRLRAACIPASQPSPTTSSASQNARNRPRACPAPMLRAADGPRRAEASTSRSHGSRSWRRRTRSGVPSREPLSHTRTSTAKSTSCAASASSCSPSVARASNAAITTLSSGTPTPVTRTPPQPSRYGPLGARPAAHGAVLAQEVADRRRPVAARRESLQHGREDLRPVGTRELLARLQGLRVGPVVGEQHDPAGEHVVEGALRDAVLVVVQPVVRVARPDDELEAQTTDPARLRHGVAAVRRAVEPQRDTRHVLDPAPGVGGPADRLVVAEREERPVVVAVQRDLVPVRDDPARHVREPVDVLREHEERRRRA